MGLPGLNLNTSVIQQSYAVNDILNLTHVYFQSDVIHFDLKAKQHFNQTFKHAAPPRRPHLTRGNLCTLP